MPKRPWESVLLEVANIVVNWMLFDMLFNNFMLRKTLELIRNKINFPICILLAHYFLSLALVETNGLISQLPKSVRIIIYFFSNYALNLKNIFFVLTKIFCTLSNQSANSGCCSKFFWTLPRVVFSLKIYSEVPFIFASFLARQKKATVVEKCSRFRLRAEGDLAWQLRPPVADDIDQAERWPRPGSLSRHYVLVSPASPSSPFFSLSSFLFLFLSPVGDIAAACRMRRCAVPRPVNSRSWLWTSAPLLFQPRSCTCATTSRNWAKSPTTRICCS